MHLLVGGVGHVEGVLSLRLLRVEHGGHTAHRYDGQFGGSSGFCSAEREREREVIKHEVGHTWVFEGVTGTLHNISS